MREFLFLTAFSIFLFSEILERTVLIDFEAVQTLTHFLRYAVACPLVLFKIIMDRKHSVKTVGIILLIEIFLIFDCFLAGEQKLVLLMLFVWAANNIDLKKTIKIHLIILTLMLIIISGLSIAGLIENRIYVQNDIRIRYSLGFNYTAYVSNIFLTICCSYIFLRRKKILALESIIMVMIGYAIYLVTDTRMAFALTIFVALFSIILKYVTLPKRGSQLVWLSLRWFVPIAAIASLVIFYLYDPNNLKFVKINLILNKRLSLGHTGILTYGIHLFGNRIEMTNAMDLLLDPSLIYTYIDSSYLQILLKFGLIVLIIIICAGTKFFADAYKKRDRYTALVLFVVFAHAILEPQLLDIIYNPFILMAGMYFTPQYLRSERCDNSRIKRKVSITE